MFFQQEYCENFCEGSLTALLVPSCCCGVVCCGCCRVGGSVTACLAAQPRRCSYGGRGWRVACRQHSSGHRLLQSLFTALTSQHSCTGNIGGFVVCLLSFFLACPVNSDIYEYPDMYVLYRMNPKPRSVDGGFLFSLADADI